MDKYEKGGIVEKGITGKYGEVLDKGGYESEVAKQKERKMKKALGSGATAFKKAKDKRAKRSKKKSK